MTPEYDNIELVYRFFEEVWNKGREDAIDEMYVQEGVAHGLGEAYKQGPEEFKLLHRLLHQTCSDIRVDIEDAIAAGDRVAMRGTATMLHNASEKQLNIEGACFVQIREGKIVEAWNAWDFLGVMIEMGAVADDGLVRAFQGEHIGN